MIILIIIITTITTHITTTTTTTITANITTGKPKLATDVGKIAMAVNCLVEIIVGGVIYYYGGDLVKVFTSDITVKDMVQDCLLVMWFFVFFDGLQVCVVKTIAIAIAIIITNYDTNTYYDFIFLHYTISLQHFFLLCVF